MNPGVSPETQSLAPAQTSLPCALRMPTTQVLPKATATTPLSGWRPLDLHHSYKGTLAYASGGELDRNQALLLIN